MWTAPEYALVITSLTGLLALGVPPIVSVLDARRARRTARKEEMERLVFYVVEKYVRYVSALDDYLRMGREEFEAFPVGKYPGSVRTFAEISEFNTAIQRLKVFTAVERINDAGFLADVDAYLDSVYFHLERPDDLTPDGLYRLKSSEEHEKDAQREEMARGHKRTELNAKIEIATTAFLTNIEVHFLGWGG